MLGRFSAPTDESLSALPAFAAVIARCQKAADGQVPHVRWFVEPFGYVEATRIANPDAPRRRGTDMLKILKNDGFTAIKGVGGFLHLATEKFEMLHQTAVYAPPVKAGENRYELAANMLDFPNGGDLKPQPWVPRDIATYASFNLKPQKIFESSKSLVNAIVGDEVFDDVITSIEEDPNGPQINIRTDLVALLGGRATIVSDYLLPITPKSERMLVGVETTNRESARRHHRKIDEDRSRRQTPRIQGTRDLGNHQRRHRRRRWSSSRTIRPSPWPSRKKTKTQEETRERMLPNSAVTVAHGQLLVASHYDFLTKMLDRSRRA